MYSKDKAGKKERREDLKQLWKLLHSDNDSFAENLEWFGRKAIDSEVPRCIEMMFATYLSLMVKVDNRLFIGTTYWDVKSRRVDRVYALLLSCGYAERIMELALGAANLFEQVKHKGYSGKASELREIAEDYKSKLERHRQECENNPVDRDAAWQMIRISNRAFANIYDIVVDGTICGGWRVNTYAKSLEESVPRYGFYELYNEMRRQRLHPYKYKWEKFLKKLNLKKRNKRKRIDWLKI